MPCMCSRVGAADRTPRVPDSGHDAVMEDAVAHVAAADPAMARLIDTVGPYTATRRRLRGGYFHALARAIVYQQLAGKAAAAIHGRWAALYDGAPTPEEVLATPDATLRSVGLSAAKATSIKDLAAKVLDGTVVLRGVNRLDDDEIVDRLTQVRGIGRWTAEMFLIFTLNRPDVLPIDDLGLQKAVQQVYGLPMTPKPTDLVAVAEPWRPWRTLATWYLWRGTA